MAYPTDAAYPTTLPGIDEARLDAIAGLIIADIANLNLALAVDTKTSALQFTSSMVQIGDPYQLPTSRISVVGGGETDGRDLETEEFLAMGKFKHVLYTDIYAYIHPTMFGGSAVPTWAENVERALSRISDHLRKRLFGRFDASGAGTRNVKITLASKEQDGTHYDVMQRCRIREVDKSIADKSIGKVFEVPCVRLMHYGEVI